jgi:L-aminoadipate-semialdehyde dehydrogenase
VTRRKSSTLCKSPPSIPHLHYSPLTSNRMPLYHFATTDLPGDTIAPEMSDVNAAKALRADATFTGEDLSAGSGPTLKIMGNYLAYLAGIGFLPKPTEGAKTKLPEMKITEDQKAALLRVGGRGALV